MRKITHDNFEVNKWTLEKKVKCNNAKMTIDLCFPWVGCRVEGIVNIGIWEDYKRGWHHPCTYLLSQCYSRLQKSGFFSENCFFTVQCASVESDYHVGKALHAHKISIWGMRSKSVSPSLALWFQPHVWLFMRTRLHKNKDCSVVYCYQYNFLTTSYIYYVCSSFILSHTNSSYE